MPSAEMRKMPTTGATNNSLPIQTPQFDLDSKDVESLVFELKENLRLSATSLKAVSCRHLCRKTSRASPYRIPNKTSACENSCCEIHRKKHKNEHGATDDDPYELLQKLLRDGELVNEAVRRLQLGGITTTKRRYSYESDEETSPTPPHWYSKEN